MEQFSERFPIPSDIAYDSVSDIFRPLRPTMQAYSNAMFYNGTYACWKIDNGLEHKHQMWYDCKYQLPKYCKCVVLA